MSNNEADRLAEQIKREFGKRGALDVPTAYGLVDALAALAKQQADKATAEPAAVSAFDDPRVQAAYQVLCSNETPPTGEHWEGFAARRIVAALAAQGAQKAEQQASPQAQSGGGLQLGVSATEQGATICLMQPHSDGSVTVIHSGTHPIGDSTAYVRLASAPQAATTAQAEPSGYALAMRVLQSDLYATLDDTERAECDAILAEAGIKEKP